MGKNIAGNKNISPKYIISPTRHKLSNEEISKLFLSMNQSWVIVVRATITTVIMASSTTKGDKKSSAPLNKSLKKVNPKYKAFNSICTMGANLPLLSYFNIAPKLKQSFALMHPDVKSNLITHIFRNFGVSRTTESDVIFAFVRGT